MRIIGSVWLTPGFARVFVLPIVGLLRRKKNLKGEVIQIDGVKKESTRTNRNGEKE
jgi:hypothetical protein